MRVQLAFAWNTRNSFWVIWQFCSSEEITFLPSLLFCCISYRKFALLLWCFKWYSEAERFMCRAMMHETYVPEIPTYTYINTSIYRRGINREKKPRRRIHFPTSDAHFPLIIKRTDINFIIARWCVSRAHKITFFPLRFLREAEAIRANR